MYEKWERVQQAQLETWDARALYSVSVVCRLSASKLKADC